MGVSFWGTHKWRFSSWFKTNINHGVPEKDKPAQAAGAGEFSVSDGFISWEARWLCQIGGSISWLWHTWVIPVAPIDSHSLPFPLVLRASHLHVWPAKVVCHLNHNPSLTTKLSGSPVGYNLSYLG